MRLEERNPTCPGWLCLLAGAVLVLPTALAAQHEYGYPDPEYRVYYDLVRDEIAVQFGKPLAAAKLAATVSAAAWADGLCAAAGQKPQLVYQGPIRDGVSDVARFKVAGGCSPTERALLARAIVEKVGDASAAGLVISLRPTRRREVLTDELIVELSADATATDKEFHQFHFRAPAPFDPAKRFFFRYFEVDDPACAGDLTSSACSGYASCLGCQPLCTSRPGSSECVACAALGCRASCDADPTTAGCKSCCEGKAGLVAALEAASAGGSFRGRSVAAVAPVLIELAPSDEEKAFDAWLKGQENLEDNLTGTIGVSFTGNEAAGESDFKVGADIKLDLGSYPGQLRVGAGAQVQFKDNVVTEDVTKLRVSYDYYFERWLELYGFLERFTNNFLSIEQRYESGVGVLFEWDAKAGPGSELCVGVPGPVHYHRSESGEVPREIWVTRRAQRMLDVYRQRLRREAREKGVVSDETKKKYCRYKLGIQKRHARFQGGLAISLFGDFEQPDELSITAKPVGDPPPPEQGGPEEIEVKVRPPSAHRFRVTLRPSLTYRPNNRTELFAHYYFKAALDEPQVESDLEPSGEAGRQEFLVGAKITLAADETGGQKVALSLSAEQFHDGFPPSVTEKAALEAFGVMDPSDASLVSFMPAGADVLYSAPETALRARRTHTVYKFALSISW